MADERSRWPTRLVALTTAGLVALHVTWLHLVRAGGPIDVDEASYLGLAFQASSPDHRILTGPFLLWTEPGYQAPLLALVTTPLHYLLGRSVEVSYLANLPFFVLLVAATYQLGRRLMSDRWAALAAIVVATVPGIADYTRHYHFALAATAVFTAALFALVRSNRFGHRGWSMAFGLALGSVVLTRTMMLAFAPGLAVAAVVAVLSTPPAERSGARRNLLLALALAAVVAASWYLFSFTDVWDYLTGFGYGSASTDYGPAAVTSLRFWLSDLVAVVSEGFYLPLTLVLVAAAAAGWFTGVRPRPSWRRLVRTDAFLVVLPLAAGAAALVSSRNTGTGFVLPLLPAAVVLAVALTSRIRPRRAALATAAVLGVLALFNTVMKADVIPALHDDRSIELAPWAPVRVVDGESVIDRYVRTETLPPTDEHPDGWDAANRRLLEAAMAHTPAGRDKPDVLLTLEGPLFNVPSMQLEVQRGDPPRINVGSLDRADLDELDDLDALTRDLAERRRRGVDQVVTGPPALAWRGFSLPESLTSRAAAAAGYRPVEAITLPDGREVLLWSE